MPMEFNICHELFYSYLEQLKINHNFGRIFGRADSFCGRAAKFSGGRPGFRAGGLAGGFFLGGPRAGGRELDSHELEK